MLSDGYCGLVKEVRQDAVKTPIVRIVRDPAGTMIDPREVDLAKAGGLVIVSTKVELPLPQLA